MGTAHNIYRYICVYDPTTDKFLGVVDVAGTPPQWNDDPFIFSEMDIYHYIKEGVNKFSRNPDQLMVIPCYRPSPDSYQLDWDEAVKLVEGFL